MRAILSEQKLAINISSGLFLLALGLLVLFFSNPMLQAKLEMSKTADARVVGPTFATGQEALLTDATTNTSIGAREKSEQNNADLEPQNQAVAARETKCKWQEQLAAFKSGGEYDINKLAHYLFEQVIEGITGISLAAYETPQLLESLALQQVPFKNTKACEG